MKKKNKYIRILIPIIITVIVTIISNVIIKYSDIELLSIFKPVALFTYFGVLIGFSLTIYTFGLSMISDIKNNISTLKNKTKEEKQLMFNGLRSGFSQIKQNIWLIFWAILIVILMAVLRNIINPFGWNIEEYQIPDTINLSLFFLSTISMYDIMKTLFNLSEINMELIKNE
jgi:hypothetical protein